MAVKKQVPKPIEGESIEGEQTAEPATVQAPIVLETKEESPWQTIIDLSDSILTIQCCNIVDMSGMGKRNCMMRMIDADTGKLAGAPEMLPGQSVVDGYLQG